MTTFRNHRQQSYSHHGGPATGASNECGKVAYQSRKAARHRANDVAGGSQHLRPYRCSRCKLWHNGHLPDAVLRGDTTAADYYGDPGGDADDLVE